MSQYWWIAKRKLKLDSTDDLTDEDKLDRDKWVEYVDNDPELTWFEETNHGKEVFEFEKKNGIQSKFKNDAHYDMNLKWGHGALQITYGTYKIHTINTRWTNGRIKKMVQIAEHMKARLYRNRTEMNEEKIRKLLEKE